MMHKHGSGFLDFPKYPLTTAAFFLLLVCISCVDQTATLPETGSREKTLHNKDATWVYEGINELRKGDIIVKPNLNLLPGSAPLPDGWFFGHAAIVTTGAIHHNPDSLLATVMIFESHALDIPVSYQLREVPGFIISENRSRNNIGFSSEYKGNRYRLRLNIPEYQIDSIIAFVRSQKGDSSNWNAMKQFPDTPNIKQRVADGERENWADNTHWYCSLLVWQAVLYVTGLDLDPNGGFYVYPNDLIVSPHFDNSRDFRARARF